MMLIQTVALIPQFDNPDLAYRQQGYQQPFPPGISAYALSTTATATTTATAWATGSLSNY